MSKRTATFRVEAVIEVDFDPESQYGWVKSVAAARREVLREVKDRLNLDKHTPGRWMVCGGDYEMRTVAVASPGRTKVRR